MEKVWGIKAFLSGTGFFDPVTGSLIDLTKSYKGEFMLRYNFKVEKGNPRGKDFYSNSPLARFLSENKSLYGKNVGEVAYDVNTRTNEICVAYYYPISSTGKLQAFLTGKGIASALERIAVRDLAKRFPDFSFADSLALTVKRKEQLRKRGVKPGDKVQIKSYWKNMLEKTRQWRRRI